MEYYEGREHIRQNATGDLTFECLTDTYVEDGSYEADFSRIGGSATATGLTWAASPAAEPVVRAGPWRGS
jgi:hypothetical protein